MTFEDEVLSNMDGKKKKIDEEIDPTKNSRSTIIKILVAWAVTVPAAMGLGYFWTWLMIKIM